MGDERFKRLQATLFVPPEETVQIEEIRRRWDPAMADRIAVHITVLHQVSAPDALISHLEDQSRTRACRVAVRDVKWAELRDRSGIYLDVLDPHDDLATLRMVIGTAAGQDTGEIDRSPHITLLHPRTTSPERRSAAWEALRFSSFSLDVTISALSIIGETEDGWSELASLDLGSTEKQSDR